MQQKDDCIALSRAWGFLVLILAISGQYAAAQNGNANHALLLMAQAQVSGYQLEGPFPAKQGETCVVCNAPASTADIAYLVDGQRVAMKREMEAEFLADPKRFVRNLQPEGMLFSARGVGDANWMLFASGAYVLVGLLFGSLCAQLAMRKNLSVSTWFVYGLGANLFAWLALRARPAVQEVAMPGGLRKIQTTTDPLCCPHCEHENHPLAGRCLHCKGELTPAGTSEATRFRTKETADD